MLYTLIDIMADLAENTLVILAITLAAGFRFPPKKQAFWVEVSILCLTLLVYGASLIETSFLPILVRFLFAILITGWFTVGSTLLRSTACIIIMLLLYMLDSLIGFSLAFFTKGTLSLSEGYLAILQPGDLHIFYALINRTFPIALSILLFKHFKKMHTLSNLHLAFLFIGFLTAYILMTVFLGLLINSPDNNGLGVTIISWTLIALCMIAVVFLIILFHNQYQRSKQLSAANFLLEEKYRYISESENKLAKRTHDFNKHLETLSRLPMSEEAFDYIHSLLQAPTEKVYRCYSGNETIDAVVGYKQSEAAKKNIAFDSTILLATPLTIASVDICAILANQLDNAIEACMTTDKTEDRFIHIHIGQQHNLVFFEVQNYVKESPFNQHGELVSRKPGRHHGLGVQNIKETVKKYDGDLYQSYENHRFTSRALLINAIDLSKTN